MGGTLSKNDSRVLALAGILCHDQSAEGLRWRPFLDALSSELNGAGCWLTVRTPADPGHRLWVSAGVDAPTPTGSTAYNLAAGGPILDPELHATVITPLAAHTLSQRPIVIPSTQEIDLYIREGDTPGRVVIDGQVHYEIREGDRLIVNQADKPFQLLRVGRRSYYTRLRKMLGWGGQPKYQG